MVFVRTERFPRRRRGLRVVAVLAASAVATVPFVPAAAAQQQGKVLRVALTTGIDHLNPFTAQLAASTQVGRFNYEFLTLPSAEDTQPTGGIAESWKTSDDKLTWTFAIRQGMKWSDGKPITAQDPAYTFQRMLDDENARTANGSYVTNFASVSAPDDKTLVIKTKAPQSSMTSLDVPIVPKHIWEPIKDLNAPSTDEMAVVGVGSGPYLLTEYKKNEFVKFKANKDYWRGAPKVDELQLLQFKDAEAAVNALKQGEVDVINRLTPTQFDALKGEKNITTNKAPGRRYNELIINFGVKNVLDQPIGDGNPILKDVRVRKAIAQAVDTNTIVEKVMNGYGQPGTGVVAGDLQGLHLVSVGRREDQVRHRGRERHARPGGLRQGRGRHPRRPRWCEAGVPPRRAREPALRPACRAVRQRLAQGRRYRRQAGTRVRRRTGRPHHRGQLRPRDLRLRHLAGPGLRAQPEHLRRPPERRGQRR